MPRYYVELPGGMIVETDDLSIWSDAKRLPAAEGKRRKQEYAKAQLLKLIQPGDTIYTVLRHVSASGMSRRIDLYAIKDNEPVFLSGYAADVLDYRRHRNKDGLIVGGCGMDMGFHLVYSLASALFPDHAENKGPDGQRRGTGYALRHEWI